MPQKDKRNKRLQAKEAQDKKAAAPGAAKGPQGSHHGVGESGSRKLAPVLTTVIILAIFAAVSLFFRAYLPYPKVFTAGLVEVQRIGHFTGICGWWIVLFTTSLA